MPESTEVEVPRRVVTTAGEIDRSTRWLLWAVVTAVLMLVAVVAYGFFAGGFITAAPRSAQERSLAITADAIAKNPTEGSAYAIRAETLFGLGRKAEAYQVLAQGEKAVGGKNPALLYILRSRTALLNSEGKFAEAEKVGQKAMLASDDYLAIQGAELMLKKVTAINGNLQTQVSVDTAIQLAAAYMGLKKYDKAIEMYNYALKLEPLGGDILTLRGFAYLASGDKVKAKADFEQTLQYLPGDPEATRGMKQLSK
jgi:tetratricopeptide (TPR) repeat protein